LRLAAENAAMNQLRIELWARVGYNAVSANCANCTAKGWQQMEKTMSAFEARRNFGKVLQQVRSNGDNVVVEWHGEPAAVVVPVSVYKQWQRRRQAFFDKMREISERVNMSEEEANELIEEAIRAVRSGKDE